MEAGDSVRVEERRFREPRFKDVDGRIGRVVELREVDGEREALVELADPFVEDWRGWIPVGCLRCYEESVNLDSFLADLTSGVDVGAANRRRERPEEYRNAPEGSVRR